MSDSEEFLALLSGPYTPPGYNVDIVYVIDATSSMESMLGKIKDAVLKIPQELRTVCKEYRRTIYRLRVKVTWFRDFYFDGKEAYGESEFFELPSDEQALRDYLSGIEAKGGGDEPESALEALTLAMRSDFVQEGNRKRHVIVLFTDAPAHRFEDYDKLIKTASGFGAKAEIYPQNMPANLFEFYEEWSGKRNDDGQSGVKTKLDQNGKRMALFTPDAYPWTDMEMDLDFVLRYKLDENTDLNLTGICVLIGAAT